MLPSPAAPQGAFGTFQERGFGQGTGCQDKGERLPLSWDFGSLGGSPGAPAAAPSLEVFQGSLGLPGQRKVALGDP